MNSQNLVYLVCSPRPRTGKTLVCRLLIDYFLLSDRTPIGFDTNINEPALSERFPQRVTMADIRTVRGQVALFDGLLIADGAPKIVDVWYRDFDRIFEVMATIDFFGEARRRGVDLLIYFIDDADSASEAAHARLRSRLPDLAVTSVRNEAATGGRAMTGPRSGSLAKFPDEPKLLVPPLDPILQRVIDLPGVSLSSFMRRSPPADVSIVVRAALRAWTSRVFLQLHDFELRRSLAGAAYLK